MKIRNGTQSSRMRQSGMTLSAGDWRTSTLFFAIRSSAAALPPSGIHVETDEPSLSLAVTLVGRSAPNCADATPPFVTCWANSEYGTSDGVDECGLKLWNTVRRTTAMITQSNRFLAMSFIVLPPNPQIRHPVIPPFKLFPARRQRVNLGAARARGLGLPHADALVPLAQAPDVRIKAFTLEKFRQERAAFFEVRPGESLGELRQVHRPRLIDGAHAGQIGGHVGKHKIHGSAIQMFFQRFQHLVLAEIAFDEIDAGDALH